jgi:hypothetical protein
MQRPLFVVRTVALAAAAALLTVGLTVAVAPAEAAVSNSSVDTSMCSNPMLSQPFMAWRDSSEYTLVPGQTPDDFNGAGWELTGGASIVTTTLADGSTASVLDMPSGSVAVSPLICVTSAYPTARAMERDVKGAEGVAFDVSYEAATDAGQKPRNTGQMHGDHSSWTAVNPVNLQPQNESGWQPMRIVLAAGGKTSEFQIYNLYVDPRMRG